MPELFVFVLSLLFLLPYFRSPLSLPHTISRSCPVTCFSLHYSISCCVANYFSKNKCALKSLDSVTYRIKSKPLNFGRPETYPIWVQPTSSSLTSCSLPFSPNSRIYAHSYTQACLHPELLHRQRCEVPTQLQAFAWKALPFYFLHYPPLPGKQFFLYDPVWPCMTHMSGTWWNHSHSMAGWVVSNRTLWISLWQLYFIYPYITSMWSLPWYIVDAQ